MPIVESAFAYERKMGILRYLRFSLEGLLLGKAPSLVNKFYKFSVYERIVEYPFIHSNINLAHGKILDIGCGSSRLPVELASRGYQAWAIDLTKYPYPITHPNLVFVQGDIRKTLFPDNFFDRVIAVSSIEHIGLGTDNDPYGDKRAMAEVVRILKVGGKVIITVPFGGKDISFINNEPRYRVYDFEALEKLFSNLKIEKIEYAAKKEGNWVPASLDEVQDVISVRTKSDYSRTGTKAVAMVVAQKEEGYLDKEAQINE